MATKTEQQLESALKDLDELKGVVSRLSRRNSELASTVGTLNRDCADLRDAVQGLQNWAREQQDDKTGRYANTERY